MTEQRFLELCRAHDITYNYSDDHSVWNRGLLQYRRIREAARELGMSKAIPIWNSVVDEKIATDSARKSFYWKRTE